MQKEIEERVVLRYVEKKDPWSSHSIFQKWLGSFARGTKVLDIGTATGILGRRCFESGLYLKGLEPVREWADMARPFYCELLCSSLEQAPEEFISFQDVVICGDVLEHTPDPEQTLRKLVNLQKPETQYFISVPNVANIWIRINLLFGRFNYTENGILDGSHLRFFTKSTFENLLRSAGLRLVEINYTPIPLPQINPFFQNNWFGRFMHGGLANLTCLLPGVFAYQFVTRSQIIEKERGI